jgi:hypothetical protein
MHSMEISTLAVLSLQPAQSSPATTLHEALTSFTSSTEVLHSHCLLRSSQHLSSAWILGDGGWEEIEVPEWITPNCMALMCHQKASDLLTPDIVWITQIAPQHCVPQYFSFHGA